jgi:hypothetical protein
VIRTHILALFIYAGAPPVAVQPIQKSFNIAKKIMHKMEGIGNKYYAVTLTE